MMNDVIGALRAIDLRPHILGPITYFLPDTKPQVVLGSGLHGDEWQVIPLLTEAIVKLHSQLPPFLFIPMLSPSAVARKQRTNAAGRDVNRSFALPELRDAEISAIKTLLLNKQPYKTVLTVHEDLDRRESYLYCGTADQESKDITNWKKALKKSEVALLNDFDSLEDDALRRRFIEGCYFFHPQSGEFVETFETWSSLHADAKQNFTLEIPGLLPDTIRSQIIEQSLVTLL